MNTNFIKAKGVKENQISNLWDVETNIFIPLSKIYLWIENPNNKNKFKGMIDSEYIKMVEYVHHIKELSIDLEQNEIPL